MGASDVMDCEAPALCNDCGCLLEPDGDDDNVCECCPSCNGQGCIEQAGSCGGGCEFCPPFPQCGECRGTGKAVRR